MVSTCLAFQLNGSVQKHSISLNFSHLKTSFSSTINTFLKEIQQSSMRIDINKTIKTTSQELLDSFVDSAFQFVDQQLLPSQSNFAPVEEIGEAVKLVDIEGEIPEDFPEGIYIRNGPNPMFGALKSTISMFGRSSDIWVEGDGMLHALHINKDNQGKWVVSYKNKYVESETFKIEKEKKKRSFLPAIEGDSTAIIAAYLLNQLRFEKVNKYISNTNVFKHGGRCYSIAENHLPHEIDMLSLKTLDKWDVNGAWDRPFTSHPKTAPGTGELVIVGVDAKKPFFVLGVVSADGQKLVHKVDLKFKRSSLCHENGVTEKYNIIMDFPLIIDIGRLIKGGQLIKYERDSFARIGVMPRYGNAESIKWFEVEPNCTFHTLNCFEDADEVVVRGCRALGSVIPGPDLGVNKFEWFSRGFKPIDTSKQANNVDSPIVDGLFFSRSYEWRLNMKTGEVMERNLSGTDFSMDFPMVNENFIGLRNKYGYTQVVDSLASSKCGMTKYGMLAKLYFNEHENMTPRIGKISKELIKVEYHRLGENKFCSGAAFVAKHGGHEEDDGWIITFVHNEDANVSQVHIIDTKKFNGKLVAKITLPQRVPYGFHGTFISKPTNPC